MIPHLEAPDLPISALQQAEGSFVNQPRAGGHVGLIELDSDPGRTALLSWRLRQARSEVDVLANVLYMRLYAAHSVFG
jgi:hypothetical protein